MPIYEYKCNACGEEFEKLVFSSLASDDVKCEKCGSTEVERKVSAVSSFGGGTSSGSFGGCGTGGFS
jgi:putative FmdB family regulatory protein